MAIIQDSEIQTPSLSSKELQVYNIRLFTKKFFHSNYKLNLGLNLSSNKKQDSLLRLYIAATYKSVSLKPNIINHHRPSKVAYGAFKNFTLQPIHAPHNHLTQDIYRGFY